ncbi:RNase H domain-containing protein [Nephila pilipes]|uniref:RNase H domain-containing protein n=1 Tax=Nephila pilipes TaxID=299642 RepID=A0A8X6IQK9_NEPPI|nr:RNase H domain-containing protein [Nephila pilipes]
MSNNQRLKRNSPLSQVLTTDIISGAVEQPPLTQCFDPSEGLTGVFFHTHLPVQVNKQTDLPIYLKQLAQEKIDLILEDAVQMYTNGSKNDSDCSCRGIFIEYRDQEVRIHPIPALFFVANLLSLRKDWNCTNHYPVIMKSGYCPIVESELHIWPTGKV